MEDWQQRVTREYEGLDKKIQKLNDYLSRHTDNKVETNGFHVNLLLLKQQLDAMLQYYNILRIRIALFKGA